MRFALKSIAVCALLAGAGASFAQKGETVKIAWLDPLSGLMAAVGTNQLKTTQFLAEEFNKKNASGVKFEIIGIDNKLSPQETTAALRSAQDQGARYILQGNGSGPALAIIDAIEKNNARNPGKELLYLNYAAVDPDLTNSKCSYWHFRLDADTSMKMEALTTWMKDQADIKKVYILGQNYAHGVQVSKYAKENLKTKRPDIQIVGDDLHPLAQVRDFSPYIAKIKASGADTVITGNWGSDLSLLIKAANDAGLNVKFLTYYAPGAGTPTAMGSASAGKVYTVAYAHYNMGGDIQRLLGEFKKKMNDDLTQASIFHAFALLDNAFVQTKSTDPVKVAAALEGMKIKSFNGEVEMRKTDHQLQQGLYIARWEKASAKYPYDAENTGYTNVPVKYYESYVASTPTTCQMKRP
ncbi:branched-chain amino acid ABC transporter substrate-binding protein [Variovorax paradoxus]|jgi:branched-chain amino acid transport system substrate-binding protein|uniref:branched-chain amino acid ABC transporter substrate-binding protein n=1 Tax=Variovorax TaxID=34072 RepID=UPI0006E6FA56|nr:MULTISPECIES: branched-chain amino acid ABC transporter substrate-binding protein [unclassified Variovorax]KPU88653.1 branched-chain amino acid ABC transporter substrate-binding protein [Variovorax paradoxus]KPU95439.1 branched-chain amino acid ABC transporter substrate-binding protein [Variovorax paradoxus]KPU96960.1 branched-chain amino acid ABC transporter substrate-binding protein [Variovorax paradoxus]KPV15514.1 branched-chain amino acid ABC transporter substrate-binding protein [Variov